ncbi:MAG: helix-turn-helix domain-containing protein [Propionibacteriales bacterium]|nr:helix-turn-helix domain-containing protein [Propionibacteriales bacterium]
MPAAEQELTLTERRSAARLRAGHGGSHAEKVSDLIRVAIEPAPWAARKHLGDRLFRGRLRPGTVVLPARPVSPRSAAVTIGLASRPIVLRSVGVAHPVAANVPWVVPPNADWRITVTEPTDLRLVHSREIRDDVIAAAVSANRPVRFEGHESKIVRAAIRSATPVWVDHDNQPVADLAITPQPGWSLIGGRGAAPLDRDQYNAFLLMMTWAIEQRGNEGDPRVASVATYIRSRLADPTLNTSTIADQLRISRRSLQTLFESEGGVAVYVRRLRLAAVLLLITQDPRQMPDLEAIAKATGLGSRRTLERSMQQVYGVTPGQARAQLLAGHPLRPRLPGTLQAS